MLRYTGAAVSGVIAVPIEQVWELVSDVTRHPVIAGSGEVQAVTIVGGGALSAGKVFESQQKMRGMRYVTANKVVAWEPPYRMAWKVGVPGLPGVAQTWIFDLSPVSGGTRVENGVALFYAFPPFPPFSWISRSLARGYAGSIVPTLDNIARLLNAPPPIQVVLREEPPPAALAHMPPPIVQGVALALGGAAMLALVRRVVGRRAAAGA
jgi:hypothetical protein